MFVIVSKPTPRATALSDPTIVKEGLDLIEHDLALEDTVAGLTATDWGGCTGVNAEVEAEDWADDAAVVKAVPVLVDGGDEQGTELGFEVGRDSDVFVEFGLVAGGIPRM
jgi:hypothetical protein